MTVDALAGLEIHVGTVVAAALNEQARKPAYVLTIDFGPLGRKVSSAQLADNYQPNELVGRQIVAVTNLPVKQVAGIASEALVLGAVSETKSTVLLRPDEKVENGTRVA